MKAPRKRPKKTRRTFHDMSMSAVVMRNNPMGKAWREAFVNNPYGFTPCLNPTLAQERYDREYEYDSMPLCA